MTIDDQFRTGQGQSVAQADDSQLPGRVLIVGPAADHGEFRTWAESQAYAKRVDTLADAEEALQRESFDVIVMSPAGLRQIHFRRGPAPEILGSAIFSERVAAIHRSGLELLSFDPVHFTRLDTHERLSLLEQKVIRWTKELLHFDNFQIRVLNKQSNRLDLAMASGMPSAANDLELFAKEEGNGISGYVASHGISYICPDVEHDPLYLPGIHQAHSSLTVPLFLYNRLIGVADFESTKPAAFNDEDRQLAELFGHYVATSLHILELLIGEHRNAEGRVGAELAEEVTGPLNDILTDTAQLSEALLEREDLRDRVRTIASNAGEIRETIKTIVTSKQSGVVARPKKNPFKDPVLHGKRILIADDEELIRETVRDVLTGYGCSVSATADGESAIKLLSEQPFDLVLSDITMPLKSGYEVFAAAKIANPLTPVILTTGFGYDPNHSIVRARREGLAAVLFKPFKIDQLLTEIRTAFASDAAPQPGQPATHQKN